MGAANNVKDECHEAVIAKACDDNWKAKYGGMTFIRSFTLFGPQDDQIINSLLLQKKRMDTLIYGYNNKYSPSPHWPADDIFLLLHQTSCHSTKLRSIQRHR